MIGRGHRGRVDANQAEIVKALRQAGCSVQSLSMVGHGCVDLLVGLAGHSFCLEVKADDKAKLTEAETEWSRKWSGHYKVVHSVPEALLAVGIYTAVLPMRRRTGGK